MMSDKTITSPLQRLIEEGAVGQLRRRDGLAATLGSEDGALKLDWVEGIARLLADPARLEEVEAEARDIRARGIRHIIWAGMGGSVLTVRVLCDLGFGGELLDSAAPHQVNDVVTIHPLDSTDPAALNAIMRQVALAKNLMLPSSSAGEAANAAESRLALSEQEAGNEREGAVQPELLHALLRDVMMIGVAMGMTSEEPITHLVWFTELLEAAGLRPAEHLLVMTLPGSYLDVFAHEHQAPSRPLQLDGGTGTGGRMSAPATRVFLLPAALYLVQLSTESGLLRLVLQRAWDEYNLELATAHPADHPFVRLAAALSAASSDDACRVLVKMPDGWHVFVSWLEQLMEESLGKGGKGVVVFDDQTLNAAAHGYHSDGMLQVHVVTDPVYQPPAASERRFVLAQPFLASTKPHDRLAALAASFLGWQLSMALYGYLHGIQFAGQPAVENYKARARALRTQPDPLRIVSEWQPALHDGVLTLLAPAGTAPAERAPAASVPPASFAGVLRDAASAPAGNSGRLQHISLGYLDVTVNGEAPTSLLSLLDEQVRTIGNMLLGIPVKLRQAPAAYHSTEQSEMDGPPYLVSLRLVARASEACLLGNYTTRFLHAQAVSTWQAMMETSRACFLLVVDGSLAGAHAPVAAFFSDVESTLRQALSTDATQSRAAE